MSTATLSAKQTVIPFLQALNEENFEQAQELLAADMKFDGVLGHRDGAEAYVADMRKMKFKYEIIKIFAESNDVCVLYNIQMGPELKVFTCGWYVVENDKIASIKVLFDPRPVLEKQKK